MKVLATLGPASATPAQIRALFEAGADAFRINMSHGTAAERAALITAVRALEAEVGRPMTVLVDLQGPKIRIGRFQGGRVALALGQRFRLDASPAPGDATRVQLPHPEVLAVLRPGHGLLLDDGRVRLRVRSAEPDAVECEVEVAGELADAKGVSLPDVVVPLPALTPKDREDLARALELGADWIALSFVQRPEDVAEARKLIGGRAALMAKIERPAALAAIGPILELADGIMVARGDLGVELPPERVPGVQKALVAAARAAGKPVVVATQMLESMVTSPVPTRAEVSDVANAIYDGADAVMLSAESAVGRYAREAVAMMDAIAVAVEGDEAYAGQLAYAAARPEPTTADAMCAAARTIHEVLGARAVVCFTRTGSTARRIARERVRTPLLVLTPILATARRLGLVWGVHAVHTRDVADFEEMVGKSKRMALRHGVARAGDRLVLLAGVPFGTPGSTNVLHVVQVAGDELERYRPRG
ncbi:MAG: pyruvate kinase [Sphingomonadaceae bacterium]|uniref:pyruvate kinase n=1 Tax=Thermaurantiacus sp. TaxID=2820283 RepID=UPI00298EF0FD|nr:pyruvate kinase [Thermaurantiacus sp.]MCS6987073.1 pyruvate kinase [Sphingomonadaceae bacterium]MDW8415589.1 pyruvate kinase [Thermaurantiacus sp.]